MEHPKRLAQASKSGPVVLLARCAEIKASDVMAGVD